MKGKTKNKAWVVAVDMGYGHFRAALPLVDIAEGGTIITANDYDGIPESDKKIWYESRRFYEIVSRFKKFPILGDFVFTIFDKFQEIKEFYPADENIDSPTFQLRQIYRLMGKKDWGRHLVQQLNKNPLPFVTTFFIPAYMAEFWGYTGQIYVVVPDTDISRAWAPLQPSKSKIIYCASTDRAAERLIRYGVKEKQVIVTGFPLQSEFGEVGEEKVKQELRRRVTVLDPDEQFYSQYEKIVKQYVGKIEHKRGKHQISLTFAIGGAGAQGELAETILESIASYIKKGTVEFHIIAGIHGGIAFSLQEKTKALGLQSFIGKTLFIHTAPNKKRYFQDFPKILSETDVLWTKPSELVFYAGLGIPIIIAPPVGSQEEFNREWLLKIGAGIDQQNPAYTADWLWDLLDEGALAKAALQGFIEIEKQGARNIKQLVCG